MADGPAFGKFAQGFVMQDDISGNALLARGIAFVDIAPVSRERGGEDAMLADDGLHPSAAMYAQWARLALPVARRLLSPA